MIRMILAIIVVIICYSIAFVMIFRVFLIAFTFKSEAPYVPSSKFLMKKAVELFSFKKGDNVIDIGSGDGRFVIFCARKFPRVNFYGIERNKFLYRLSAFMAKIYGLKNVEFINADARDYNYSKFNKLYLFMPDFFAGEIMKSIKKDLSYNSMAMNIIFGFGSRFEKNEKIIHKTFTQWGKKSKISLWYK